MDKDKERDGAMAGMSAWFADLGLDEPSSETMDDMAIQKFYGDVENMSTDTSDDLYGDVVLLNEYLEQLHNFQTTGLLDKRPPIPQKTMLGESVTSEERLDNVYYQLARKLNSISEDYDLYGYNDGLDMTGYDTRDDAVAGVTANIKSDLQSGHIKRYSTGLDTIGLSLMDDERSKDDARPDVFMTYPGGDFEGSLEDLLLDEFTVDGTESQKLDAARHTIDNRIRTNTKVTPKDIAVINSGIQAQYADILENYTMQNVDIDARRAMSDRNAAIRNYHNIGLSETTIPAFVEDELGTTDTPDVILEEAYVLKKTVESDYKSKLLDLYEKTYALQTFDFSDVSADVTGRRSDMSKATPMLITQETKDLLGPDYAEFCDKKFEDALQGFRERNILGIDASKSSDMTLSNDGSMDSQKEVAASKGNDEIKKDENSVAKSVNAERRLPSGIQEIYNEATADDDYSFDESDYGDDE